MKPVYPRRRGHDGDAVHAAGGGYRVTARGPVRRSPKIVVLLQVIAAVVWPGDNDAVARTGDRKIGQSRRLHDGNQTPKAASQRKNASTRGAARLRLANGAADGKNAAAVRACAGDAAPGDFIPVYRIDLRMQGHWAQQAQE